MVQRRTKEERERKPQRIRPKTADAIKQQLTDGQGCRKFRNKGTLYNEAYNALILSVLSDISKTNESMKEEHSRSEVISPVEKTRSSSTITLSKWAIKLVPEEESGLGLVVIGVIKDTESIVQSSFVKKRLAACCVISKSTTYVLEGEFDRHFKPYPGFRDATIQKFKGGFPVNWSSLVKAEIAAIKQLQITQRGPARALGSEVQGAAFSPASVLHDVDIKDQKEAHKENADAPPSGRRRGRRKQ
ncbi:hypothetical protein NECID01_0326 [Nematocida sp. AWRm77]|nr:hypothetical protein NECID01_0326 [Nematocida sp. AWRm77]